MRSELPTTTDSSGILLRDELGPAGLVLRDSGERARKRIFEFFAARIENDNTRRAYLNALRSFFGFCFEQGVGTVQAVGPVTVSAYLQYLKTTPSERTGRPLSKPTRKQHLAAIRHLYDWLVTGQVVEVNPAHSVRGPKHKVRRGKTPHMEPDQARQLLDSIDTSKISGLRDRALIASMLYTFARVNAITSMKVEDFYQNGRRWWFRLEEKNGKVVEMPGHHNAEDYVAAYLEAAGIHEQKSTPLFRSLDRKRELTDRPLSQQDVIAMIKRRCLRAGLPDSIGCHSMRATGITAYLKNGGQLEHAQRMAAHESSRTTGLYDRRSDEITLDEVERISI